MSEKEYKHAVSQAEKLRLITDLKKYITVDEIFESVYEKLRNDMLESANNMNYSYEFSFYEYCDNSKIRDVLKKRIIDKLEEDGFKVILIDVNRQSTKDCSVEW